MYLYIYFFKVTTLSENICLLDTRDEGDIFLSAKNANVKMCLFYYLYSQIAGGVRTDLVSVFRMRLHFKMKTSRRCWFSLLKV